MGGTKCDEGARREVTEHYERKETDKSVDDSIMEGHEAIPTKDAAEVHPRSGLKWNTREQERPGKKK